MGKEAEALFQRIGKLSLDSIGHCQGRVLVYAEVEEGAGSADIFAETTTSAKLVHTRGSLVLFRLFYSLWKSWDQDVGAPRWSTACYLIEGSSFHVDFGYDDLSGEPGPLERRAVVLRRYFGDVQVEYGPPPPSAVQLGRE